MFCVVTAAPSEILSAVSPDVAISETFSKKTDCDYEF